MKLSNILYFDDEDGKFVAEKFFIDGNEVSEEGFEEMLDELDEVNCVDEEEENCCDCVNCTLDRFTEEIFELANGQICCGCVRDMLCDFLDEIVSHIVVEDIEDDEEDLEENAEAEFIGFLKSLDDRISILEKK